MTFSILSIRHSGPSLLGRTNATRQYGGPMVAPAAIYGGHFVGPGQPRGRVPSPSLPLPATGAKPLGAAACAPTQGGVHGQPSLSPDPSGAKALPSARSTDQPGRDPGVGS